MPDVRMPDGTIMRNVPANATKQQIEVAYRKAREAGAVKDSRPESFWRGAVNEMSKGGANAQMAMEYINPLLAVAGLALNRGKLGSTASREQAQREARNSKYQGSTAGKIAGGVVGSLPAAFVPGGPVLQGALGGAMLTDNPYDPKQLIANAGMGAIGGQWGHVAGKQVVAPVLERVARTAPAQALGRNVVAPAINAAVNSRIGQKITRGAPKVNMGNAPKYSVADKAVRKVNPRIEAARANLEQAKALGLPYALADASPELRMLAGSVARKSPNARALAEQTFEPRGQGQAERAINAIDQYLAPVTNIEKRAGAIRQGAWDAADPLYQKAFAQPAPVDDQLNALLSTPAGKDAMRRAEQIAANEGVNITEQPSFEVMNYAKRGLDSVLNDNRSPLSGKLDLEGDPVAQSVNSVLQRFKGRLDELNPDYAAARQAYQTGIEPRTALNLGYKELPRGNVPERQFTEAMSRIAPENLPEAQRGYATAMADAVDRQRLAVNPYNTVHGSPLQQAKVAALFPDGADKFAQTANLERDMQKTLLETIGGSPTQARRMADETFDSGLSPSSIMEFATAPKLSIAKRVGRWASDTITTGGQGKADEIAPALFNTDTSAVLQYLDDLMRKDAEMAARRRAYGKAGGLFGFPAAAGLVSAGQ